MNVNESIDLYNSMKKGENPWLTAGKISQINNDTTCNIEIIINPGSELVKVTIPSGMTVSEGDVVEIGYENQDTNRPIILQKMDFLIDEEVEVCVREAPASGGKFYIADSGNYRIQIFDLSFNLLQVVEV